MGRRENAVTADTRQLEALALWLRAQRRRAALTYAAMSQRINYDFTASMLSRAASGKTVPTWQVVEAFARACDVDSTEGRRLWKAARAAKEHTRRRRAAEFEDLADKVYQANAHPKVVETVGELRRAMVHLRARDGQPSLAELQRRAGRVSDGGKHRLPKSSIGAVLRGDAVPTRGHVVAFTRALGMSRRKVVEWGRAWDRIVGEAGAEIPASLPRQRTDRHRGIGSDLPGTAGPAPKGRTHPRTRNQAGTDFISFYVVATTESDVVHVYHGNPERPWSRLPRFMRGPLPPLPPAGRTGSGLPIRAPRRYTSLTPAHRGSRARHAPA
ncbi:helix-turn-helix domain-containing protein [Streptomyces sp. NPDC054865]